MAVELIDTTVRDGNQSLWGATGLDTAMMLQIAPVMDRVGFAAVDFTTSTHMAVAVRFKKEDPWERIRLMAAAMPKTPLQFLTTGLRFISWEIAHPELLRLVTRLQVAAGIRRFAVMDPMNDMAAVLTVARTVREEGGEQAVAALAFTQSPVHDDAYYARCATALAASPDVHRLYLKDPGGLLSPERARTLLPAIRAAWGTRPFELHSHCTIGLAPFSYLEAAKLGVDALHTAVAPLANGTSQPAAERTVANLRELGHTVDIDDAALAEMSAYFRRLAEAEGLPVGTPQDYDPAYFRHQVPGGMVTTMTRQLKELNLIDRLPAVFEEVGRVRAELGYPIMVTPFSQIVGTQAVMNIVGRERYATVPDEVIRYVIGRFGAPMAPVDPDVKDRILALPRAKELRNEPPMPGLAELRRRLGKDLPDEELVLRAVMGAEQVDAMLAAGPAKRRYDPDARPIIALMRGLTKRRGVSQIVVEKPGFRLELKAHRSKEASDARA
jgi:oxaloacetate decarboxylase alpha subunit